MNVFSRKEAQKRKKKFVLFVATGTSLEDGVRFTLAPSALFPV